MPLNTSKIQFKRLFKFKWIIVIQFNVLFNYQIIVVIQFNIIFNEQLLFVIQFIGIFNLIVKEVLRLVKYDDGVITAPQWVPIWRFWSQLGLFTVFGPHFYRLKSLISPYYMLFGKIQFRNDLLTMIFLSNSIKKIIHFSVINQIQFNNLFIF